MKHSKKSLTLGMLLSVLLFVGCGDDAEVTNPTIQTGVFLDSAVAGISYETETQSGVTDIDGTFKYTQGETITFKIGDITLPSATAGAVITPLTLADTTDVNNIIVSNISRLLQTIDEDGNASNGISIASATLEAGLGQTIDFNTTDLATEVSAFLIDAQIPLTDLVTETDALAHLNETLSNLIVINTYEYSFQKSQPYNLRIFKDPADASYTEEEYNDYTTAGKLVRTVLSYTGATLDKKRILHYDLNVSGERRLTKIEQTVPNVVTWEFNNGIVLRQDEMILHKAYTYESNITKYSNNNPSTSQYADLNQTVTVIDNEANATDLNSAYNDCIVIDQNRTTSGLFSDQNKTTTYCLGIGKVIRVVDGVTVKLESIQESPTDLVP